MFKQKYLKQLQDVQTLIKGCKATRANLKPPSPPKFSIGKEIDGWFHALFRQYDPAMKDLIESCILKDESIYYLRKLGEYFVNVAFYYEEETKYKEELERLQDEERRLKDKLGID